MGPDHPYVKHVERKLGSRVNATRRNVSAEEVLKHGRQINLIGQ
jgi:hypothetical protein